MFEGKQSLLPHAAEIEILYSTFTENTRIPCIDVASITTNCLLIPDGKHVFIETIQMGSFMFRVIKIEFLLWVKLILNLGNK